MEVSDRGVVMGMHKLSWIAIGTLLLMASAISGCQKTPLADAGPPPLSPALRQAADRFLLKAEQLRVERADIGRTLKIELAAGRYDAVEATLTALDQLDRADPRYEFVYLDALDAIVACDSPDDSMQRPLLSMQEAKPQSAWPHVLLAHFYGAMACSARGTGWARDVGEDQLNTMKNFDRRAYAEYQEAMAIDPDLFPVYEGLLHIANGLGTLDEITAIYKQSRLHLPDSYLLASDYMTALKPRWHGDYSLMYRFANQMRKLVGKNPRFYDLGGYVAADQANLAYNDKDYAAAFKLYTQALGYGDFPSWLEWGAESARGINQFRVAYAYYQRYLLYKPQDVAARKRWGDFAPACVSPSATLCHSDKGFPWAGEMPAAGSTTH